MANRLHENLSSRYVEAANKLRPKASRRKIIAYVESYDDIFFWRTVLSSLETPQVAFQVMLPSRSKRLERGKKAVLMNLLGNRVGDEMIACVDADYDYLIQGKTHQSEFMLNNPYVIHTYVYAIENYQCYAPSLHNVCVMATLNDHLLFDFNQFLSEYTPALFPLFVWSIMLYRKGEYHHFTITDFNIVATIKHMRMSQMGEAVDKVRHKAFVKVKELQRKLPGRKEEYLKTKDSLLALGVTPDTTYFYMQGHHLFDNVVAPTMQSVCDELRREREREIKSKALHSLQMQNELSAYTKAQSDISSMLKKNQGYTQSAPYQRMIADIDKLLKRDEK